MEAALRIGCRERSSQLFLEQLSPSHPIVRFTKALNYCPPTTANSHPPAMKLKSSRAAMATTTWMRWGMDQQYTSATMAGRGREVGLSWGHTHMGARAIQHPFTGSARQGALARSLEPSLHLDFQQPLNPTLPTLPCFRPQSHWSVMGSVPENSWW